MKYILLSLSAVLALSACAQLKSAVAPKPSGDAVATPDETTATRPQARPSALNTTLKAPPVTARTVDQFDTTSVAEKKAAAQAAPVVQSNRLGLTVASLGSPADPGFWLETPLVDAVQAGRVVYPANGKSVAVELRPIAGPKTAGCRLSLPAMRVIEAPLTGLPEVEVFTQ
jgi:hypothetical protein